MTTRSTDPEKPWRELLTESFCSVEAIGGLFALDLEYYTDKRRKPDRFTGCCGATVLLRKRNQAA
jgi:hypothetical protein